MSPKRHTCPDEINSLLRRTGGVTIQSVDFLGPLQLWRIMCFSATSSHHLSPTPLLHTSPCISSHQSTTSSLFGCYYKSRACVLVTMVIQPLLAARNDCLVRKALRQAKPPQCRPEVDHNPTLSLVLAQLFSSFSLNSLFHFGRLVFSFSLCLSQKVAGIKILLLFCSFFFPCGLLSSLV